MRTLVCIIGQIRIPNLTWDRFKKHVLDELNADLALCIHVNEHTDRNNEYFKNAKYVFEYSNNSGCWAGSFDTMNPGWRDLVDIPGDWIGAIKEPIVRPGSGGILIFLRWWLYQNLITVEPYDRIITSRSDFMWLGPHPTLDNDHIWLPNAEFHGGLCDRHFVIPYKFLKDVLTIGHMENIQQTKDTMARNLKFFGMNDETFVYSRFLDRKLLEHVGFFPMKMFVCKDQSKVEAKYPDELESSREIVTWPFHIDHKHLSKRGMFVGRVTSILDSSKTSQQPL